MYKQEKMHDHVKEGDCVYVRERMCACVCKHKKKNYVVNDVLPFSPCTEHY